MVVQTLGGEVPKKGGLSRGDGQSPILFRSGERPAPGQQPRRISKRNCARGVIARATAARAGLLAIGIPRSERRHPGLFRFDLLHALVYGSALPLWVHEDPHALSCRQILFATDFSPGSEQLFRQVVRLFSGASVGLTLLHQDRYAAMLETRVRASAGAAMRIRAWDRATARRWAAEATVAGLPAKNRFLPPSGRLADALLRETASHPDAVIALACQTPRWVCAISGNTVWRVLCESRIPVLTRYFP
jgi:hypothetical protein